VDSTVVSNNGIAGLIEHANLLALTLTQTMPTTTCFLAIVDLYECVTAIVGEHELVKHVAITIPRAQVVYLLYFSQSLAVVSRLCGVLAAYKRAYELTMSTTAARIMTAEERQSINVFNGFLMDICNCMIRSRAFAADSNAQQCRVPAPVVHALRIYAGRVDVDLRLDSLLDVSHAPVLAMQSIEFVRALEEAELDEPDAQLKIRHAGPVTTKSLDILARRGGLHLQWLVYRSGVVEYLEGKGAVGIADLVYNTMKNFKKDTKS
jgi:centromere protein I